MISLERPPTTPSLTVVLLLALALVGGSLGSAPASGAVAPRDETTFASEWSWPLVPVPTVLRQFENPPEPWQRGHRGVDLAVVEGGGVAADGVDGRDAIGAQVLSPADGVVFFAGTVVDRGVLTIDHGGGRLSSFEPVSTDLTKGERVREGEVVAALARTAAASGPWHCASPCVHWGVRVDGEYVDPLAFVMDRRPSVLLPLEQ